MSRWQAGVRRASLPSSADAAWPVTPHHSGSPADQAFATLGNTHDAHAYGWPFLSDGPASLYALGTPPPPTSDSSNIVGAEVRLRLVRVAVVWLGWISLRLGFAAVGLGWVGWFWLASCWLRDFRVGSRVFAVCFLLWFVHMRSIHLRCGSCARAIICYSPALAHCIVCAVRCVVRCVVCCTVPCIAFCVAGECGGGPIRRHVLCWHACLRHSGVWGAG